MKNCWIPPTNWYFIRILSFCRILCIYLLLLLFKLMTMMKINWTDFLECLSKSEYSECLFSPNFSWFYTFDYFHFCSFDSLFIYFIFLYSVVWSHRECWSSISTKKNLTNKHIFMLFSFRVFFSPYLSHTAKS